MKKLILSAITCLSLNYCLHAQSMFGVKGGLNIANLTNSESGGLDDATSINSFHVGITSSLPVNDLLSFQPSLIVTGKGSEVTVGNTDGLLATGFTSRTNPIYLELPVTFNVNLKLGEGSSVFAGAGGYAAMGIAGSVETHGKRLGMDFSSSDKIDYSEDDPTTNQEEGAAYGKLKRFDYGLTFTAGMILKGFLVSAYYDYGLAKINSATNNNQDDKYKNMVLGFSVGYLIDPSSW